MKKETREYIERFHMVTPGDGVLVGLSGGADSVCLLHLLWCLKDELSITLRALHVHHGLRGAEADRDAEFSRRFCESLQIPFAAVRIDAAAEAVAGGISVEEAGRQARYRILTKEAERWESECSCPVKIAVAHHGDDNVETILYHLFRGSGLRGLSGIPPVRGRIIRPLLYSSRIRILAYLEEEGLSWTEDSTNGENDYTRNRIRNQLIPWITEEINAQAAANILRAGERIGQADRHFEALADAWLDLHGERQEPAEYRLSAAALAAEEEIVQGYILRQTFCRLSCPLKDISSVHLKEILALTGKETGKQVMLPHGIRAEREYESIRIRRTEPIWENMYQNGEEMLHMRVFPCKNWEEFPRNQYTKWFDYDKINGALAVRTRQPGDYFILPGGGRKTVKSYLIDKKIPREERERLLLLADGAHILWIVGRRISEYYKVTEHTKMVLEVHADGGKKSGR